MDEQKITAEELKTVLEMIGSNTKVSNQAYAELNEKQRILMRTILIDGSDVPIRLTKNEQEIYDNLPRKDGIIEEKKLTLEQKAVYAKYKRMIVDDILYDTDRRDETSK